MDLGSTVVVQVCDELREPGLVLASWSAERGLDRENLSLHNATNARAKAESSELPLAASQ